MDGRMMTRSLRRMRASSFSKSSSFAALIGFHHHHHLLALDLRGQRLFRRLHGFASAWIWIRGFDFALACIAGWDLLSCFATASLLVCLPV